MVAHKDIRVDAAARTVLVDSQGEEILLKIHGILENALLLVAADDDVVEGTGEFYAGFARHGRKIANRQEDINISSFQA